MSDDTTEATPRRTGPPRATTYSKATGFSKKSGVLVIDIAAVTSPTHVTVQADDFPRMLSIMVEGASQEQLEALHRCVAMRRKTIHERSATNGRMGQG